MLVKVVWSLYSNLYSLAFVCRTVPIGITDHWNNRGNIVGEIRFTVEREKQSEEKIYIFQFMAFGMV